MNGIVYFDDGNGFSTDGSGDITCNTLTATVLNVATFVVGTITATFAYITTLYVNNIRSNSLNPELFSDTTYNSAQLVNKCDCDIAIAGGQTGTRLTIGGNVARTSDIDIGNGTGNACNVNISSNATATGQVGIKRFVFSLNNVTYAVIGTAINLFTTTTANIQLGKWIFNAQTLNPASTTTLCNIGNNITTGGLTIGNSSTMNSDINILVGTGRSVNIPNLVIGSLTGVTGNFNVAGILTAGTTNAALIHQISKLNLQNQTVYAVDPTQPIQFGTSQTTGALNIGSSTNTNQIGNVTVTNTTVSSASGSLTVSPTTLTLNPSANAFTLLSTKFGYVSWKTYTMVIRDTNGTNATPLTISQPAGTTYNTIFAIIGNVLHIRHTYIYSGGNTGVYGSGVYGYSLPTSTDVGFTYNVNNAVLARDTSTNANTGTNILESGMMNRTGVYADALTQASWANILIGGTIYPQFFLLFNASTYLGYNGNTAPKGYVYNASAPTTYYSFSVSIPITIV